MNKLKVWSPAGLKAGQKNSLVGKGESIIDFNHGLASLVTKGRVGVDNQPSSVIEGDSNVIVGNDVDWSTGIKFSDQAAPITAKLQSYNDITKNVEDDKYASYSSLHTQTKNVLQRELDKVKQPLLDQLKIISDKLKLQHEQENQLYSTGMYKKGKDGYPEFKKGSNTWAITAGRLLPTLMETGELLNWIKNKPQGSNTYRANPYEKLSLLKLALMRYNPFPELLAQRDAERRAAYALLTAGGLNGALRYLGRVALGLDNLRNAGNVYRNALLHNNDYITQYANLALAAGAADSQNRTNAARYDYDTYAKSHGARVHGIETHLAGLGLQWLKYFADRLKTKQYNDTLDIYRQQLSDEQQRFIADMARRGFDQNGRPVNNTTRSVAPTVYNHHYTPATVTMPTLGTDYGRFGGSIWNPSIWVLNPATRYSNTPQLNVQTPTYFDWNRRTPYVEQTNTVTTQPVTRELPRLGEIDYPPYSGNYNLLPITPWSQFDNMYDWTKSQNR